jgi:4-alpha-glucanotransferase
VRRESGSALLAELARAHGLLTDGPAGAPVAGQTLRLLLEALGVPASTDGEVRQSVQTQRSQWRPLPAVVTARAGRGERVRGCVPEGREASAVVVTAEGHERCVPVEVRPELARTVGGDRVVPVTVVVPGDLPVGRHLLTLSFTVSGASVPLLVAPQVFPSVPGRARVWGLGGATASVTTSSGQVCGDLADLAELVSWVGADLAGDFVLCPPAGPVPVPFADPARIRVGEVPEYAGLLGSGGTPAARGWPDALRALYAVPRSPRRQRAFDAFCVARGQALLDYATWLVLVGLHGEDPGSWPEPLRDARSDAVAQLREDRADDINFHRWCQWVADSQHAEAAREAGRVGMAVGLVVPVPAPGAEYGWDAWSLGSPPVRRVRLGQPPTVAAPEGLVGASVPWSPASLRGLGYGPLSSALDVLARHAGGLLLAQPSEWFRRWWVPEGLPASEGAWVEHDHEAVVAAVGIAAHRHGAAVLADLGALEDTPARWLLSQGVLPLTPPGGGDGHAGALRWVDVADLAEGGELTLGSLAASASVRRKVRRLTR